LRLVVAFWNGFFGPSPGADLDALGFHGFALNVALTGILDDFTIGYVPYTNLLGIFYGLTISHIFIGSILSCVAWLVSSYFLYKTFIVFGVTKSHTKIALLLYSVIPSSVMITAITLREPYQLLFANIAIYSITKIILTEKFSYYFLLIFSIFCMGVLHGALLAFGILILSGVFMLQKLREKIIRLSIGLISISIIIIFILLTGLSFFSDVAYNLDDGLDNAIQGYQLALLTVDARTNYKSHIQITGLSDLLIFIPIGFFQYLFEPFPWRVSTASDALLLCENMLRFYLMWKILRCARIEQVRKRRLLNFMFIFYFLIEAIWSIGTINWGTSVRHHIPAWGFLLLAAYASTGLTDFKIKSKSKVPFQSS
jgi:hypothetical protein